MTDLPPPVSNSKISSDPSSSGPPPMPEMSLTYSAPTAAGPKKPPFAQQAAMASWIAPLVAWLIESANNSSFQQGHRDFWTVVAFAIIDVTLVLGGLILGIIALCGIRRHGRKKILAPAIVGICVNGLLLAGGVAVLLVLPRINRMAAARYAAMHPTLTAQQAKDSLTKSPGWVGQATRNGTVIRAFTVSNDTPLGQEMKRAFGANYLFIDLAIHNANGTAPVAISASDVSVALKDGGMQAALRPQVVFASAPGNSPELRSAYPVTASLPAGATKPVGFGAFLPAEVDPAQIDHLILVIDGAPLTVPGKFLSAEEKAKVLITAKSP